MSMGMKAYLAVLSLVAAMAVAVLATLGAIDPVKAGGWTGCYGGVSGTYNARVAGDLWGSEGPGAGLSAGCDVQTGKFVAGLEGGYDWRRFDWAATDIDVDGWKARARLGYLVNPATLAYAAAGWTDLDMSGGPASDADGWLAGAGTEFDLGSGFFGRVEYEYLQLDSDVTAIDPDIHTGRVGLLYKFDFAKSAKLPSFEPTPLK